MSMKPDFSMMTTPELRAYLLDHRDNEEALHAYLDRRHSENPNARLYNAEDDVSEAISGYLEKKKHESP
jgi:hypothetical protein